MAGGYSDMENTVPLHNGASKSGIGKKKLVVIGLVALLVVAAVVVPVVVTQKHKGKKHSKSAPGSGEGFQPDLSLPSDSTCKVLDVAAPNNGSGPLGMAMVNKTMVLSNLEVPWQLAYEPGGTLLFMTERAGKLSQFVAGVGATSLKLLSLVPDVAKEDYTREGGLLGLAVDFSSAVPYFYIYVTSAQGGQYRNRVERWIYDKAGQTATFDKVILDNIPSAPENNGGFLSLTGGFLYIATGDADKPSQAQDTNSLAGKILRINPDGTVPADNPFKNAVYIYGLRNPAGFSFLDANTLIIADHGVGGVDQGGDRVVVGKKGDNLGWGITINCQTNKAGEGTVVAARFVFGVINPPGGILVYNPPSIQEQDITIPAWKGHVLLTSLRGRNLQDITLSPPPSYDYLSNEVYFLGAMKDGGMGRLRIILITDRNVLYVGTSNCDARGKDVGACKNGTMDAIYSISAPVG